MEPDNDRFVVGCGYAFLTLLALTLIGAILYLLPL
jgi:hypothetical protein